MSHYFIQKTLLFIQNNTNYNKKELLKIQYGIEGVFLTLFKVFFILLIGVIFHYFPIVFITILFFNILRFFAFGLHAKKSSHCLILSLIEFNLLPYLLLRVSISSFMIWMISIITLISFLLFAPADTEKRPLTNPKKRNIRKILSIVSFFIMLIIAYHIKYLQIPIMAAFLIEDFSINPLSYRMLGLSYNNYKNQ